MRFYKFHDGVRGDRSEAFSFASFFPDSLSLYLKPLSTSVYRLLVSLHLLPTLPVPMERQLEEQNVNFDTERRKALAIQAVNDRLQLKGRI